MAFWTRTNTRTQELDRLREELDAIRGNVLTPYLGEPLDIARMALFLASEESKYITAQLIEVNGGALRCEPAGVHGTLQVIDIHTFAVVKHPLALAKPRP